MSPRRVLSFALLAALSGPPAFARAAEEHVADQLVALNQTLIEALSRGDKEAAGAIYADDFLRTTVQGAVLTRAEVLDGMKPPAPGTRTTYESRDLQVHQYGDTAAVLVYLSVRHSEGKPDFLYRVTDTFVKQKGRWRKAASAGTPVVAAP